MLIITRNEKKNRIDIDGGISVKVLAVDGGNVKLGIDAPKETAIIRHELNDRTYQAERER